MGDLRGADGPARALERGGVRTIFTLSGNHIMPIFDAVLETGLKLVHVRHEAAAVHMADAWARLTGKCGVALVTGGPGHANAVGALYTALAAESPVVLLSGHASLAEIGRGAFQELDQAEMARPTTKASWKAHSAADLAEDIEQALRLAQSGRPGPVHVSLPFDCLDDEVDRASAQSQPGLADGARVLLSDIAVAALRQTIDTASRPLLLAGPALCHPSAGGVLTQMGETLGVPAIGMESPRGVNDPALGAFPDVLRRADLVILLGKAHDFTLRFAEPPFVDPACRFVVIDPEAEMIGRVAREKGSRLVFSAVADARSAAERLLLEEPSNTEKHRAWLDEVRHALQYRPPEWDRITSQPAEQVHPVAFCRAIASVLDEDSRSILVCDGGEIGQWAQSLLKAERRIINGVAGSIGAAVPFAIGARAADPDAPVIAITGDGAFGFHMAEFDTAVRYGLPFVAVIGNDATWNAEHQIQLRAYGPQRAHGCELLPTRYDKVVEALGGHGEFVTSAEDLAPALRRALKSGKPACVNVLIQRLAAPTVRLS